MNKSKSQLIHMILLRSRLLRFFHFVKPAISSIGSKQDLEVIMQKRLLRNIAEANEQTLRHFSFRSAAKQTLLVSEAISRELEERSVHLSVIDPSTQKPVVLEAMLRESLEKLDLQGFNLGLPFVAPNQGMHHFSEQRGAPNFEELQEYDFNDHTLHIFNLPENISEQDIQATIKASDAKVTFKYCILGLPAYASVRFQTPEDLSACLDKLPSRRIAFGERTAVVRGPEDADRLRLGNRRLVVALEEDSELNELALELSKYGRVLHVDWPLEASLNPTLDEVKEFYKSSTELIRINKFHKDGTIESEFYPPVHAWQPGEDERGSNDNIIERAEKLKESYENRTRFARNINVHLGKEHRLSLVNRGYFVVTYSTFEECQSLYFSHGAETKMQLVGDQLDFEFDPLFKRELLRQIDNEYLAGKKTALKEKEQYQKEFVNPTKQSVNSLSYRNPRVNYTSRDYVAPDSMNIFLQIFNKVCFKEMTESKEINSYYLQNVKDNNVFQRWQEYVVKYDDLKQKVEGRKTFDQLAEIELYGRVLPKDQNIERLIVENAKNKQSREDELIEQNNLLTTHREVMIRNKFYRRQQDRRNRIALQNEEFGIADQEVPAEEVDEAAADADADDGENIGKAAFSTRRPAFLYRKRTAEEEAHFQMRYHQFVRSTIYEYMGVFHDKDIEEAAEFRSSLVNPQSLKWSDGTPFFNEEDLVDALQFRRDFAAAQQEYEDYVYSNQYVRSSGAHVNQINANRANIREAAIQHLTDVGLVENVRKVAGKDLEKKVGVLNAQTAEFGEEYRLQKDERNELLVKVRKLENLIPLDRVSHLENFISEHGEDITPEQAGIFEKHYQQMNKSGVIPDEVSDAFRVKRGLKFNDLLAAVGAPHQIYKKDLQMAERAKTYSSRELNQDINEQMRMQRSRRQHRKLNNDSFAKDPSQIYVKDHEGYYKVSRYRQI